MLKTIILIINLIINWPIIIFFKNFYLNNNVNTSSLNSLKDGEIIEIILKNEIFKVEVSLSQSKKELGLSKRNTLNENEGMIFIFEKPQKPFFWMKDMNFGLDFIWINKNQIVDLTENVFPSKNLFFSIVYPKEKVDKVLEVKAGTIKKLNLKKRDRVIFKKTIK